MRLSGGSSQTHTTIPLLYGQRRRLELIGRTEIRYGLFNKRPSQLGAMKLRYTFLTRKLSWIGATKISYGWFDSRPRRLGQFDIEYRDDVGRPERIGPIQIKYDRWGRFPRAIGKMRLAYDNDSGIPSGVVVGHHDGELGSVDLVVLFFVLHLGSATATMLRR